VEGKVRESLVGCKSFTPDSPYVPSISLSHPPLQHPSNSTEKDKRGTCSHQTTLKGLRHIIIIPLAWKDDVAAASLWSMLPTPTRVRNFFRSLFPGFAKGKSVQDRMLFLYVSRKIIDTFSRKYFREHFFDQTLLMAGNKRSKTLKLNTVIPSYVTKYSVFSINHV